MAVSADMVANRFPMSLLAEVAATSNWSARAAPLQPKTTSVMLSKGARVLLHPWETAMAHSGHHHTPHQGGAQTAPRPRVPHGTPLPSAEAPQALHSRPHWPAATWLASAMVPCTGRDASDGHQVACICVSHSRWGHHRASAHGWLHHSQTATAHHWTSAGACEGGAHAHQHAVQYYCRVCSTSARTLSATLSVKQLFVSVFSASPSDSVTR